MGSKLEAMMVVLKVAIGEELGVELPDDSIERIATRVLAKPQRDPTVLEQVTSDILAVCGWTNAMYGRAAKMAKKLIADGVHPGDILRHYGRQDPGPEVWWWRRPGTDWRSTLTDAVIAETRGRWGEKPAPVAQQSRLESHRDMARIRIAAGLRELQAQEVGYGD